MPRTSSADPARYDTMAISLHWLLALALVGIFVLGVYMVGLPFSPQRLKLFNWHKWAGIVILSLSALRLIWRLTHPAPALHDAVVAAMPGWQLAAHQITHVAMYGLFLVVPLLGWVYSSASGFPVVLFGVLPLPDLIGVDKALAETLKDVHALAAWSLAMLVLLHVGAALKHHFVDRDGLLQRMWPGRAA
jgi:cytochrome b561